MSTLPFPEDIIIDILTRLSVKDLLRYRTVSKWLLNLIDSSQFINSHLRRSITSHKFTLLRYSKKLFWAPLDSPDSSLLVEQPLMCYNSRIKVVGCCNGLVCIRNIVDDIAFWNPSTRKHKVLPFLHLEKRRYSGNSVCSICIYGFGYDSVHDDYKLVRVAQFCSFESRRKNVETEVKVFSLVSNKWRRIGDMDYIFRYPNTNGVFVCGCLHWTLSRFAEVTVFDTVVSLDLATEEHKELDLPGVECPEFVDRIRGFEIELGSLGGCLSVVYNYCEVRSDIWVMNEYGVKDSWTKKFSLTHDVLGRHCRTVRPFCYVNGENEILFQQYKSDLFVYDVRKKSIRNFRMHGAPISFKVCVCTQSLVSFNMYDGANRIAAEEKIEEERDFLSKGFKLVL